MGPNFSGWGAEGFGTWEEGEQAGEGGAAGPEGHEEEVPQGGDIFWATNTFFGQQIPFLGNKYQLTVLDQVSREGDFLVFVEKKGLLTTQNGTQQITERRVRLGGTDLNTLEELGFWDK